MAYCQPSISSNSTEIKKVYITLPKQKQQNNFFNLKHFQTLGTVLKKIVKKLRTKIFEIFNKVNINLGSKDFKTF